MLRLTGPDLEFGRLAFGRHQRTSQKIGAGCQQVMTNSQVASTRTAGGQTSTVVPLSRLDCLCTRTYCLSNLMAMRVQPTQERSNSLEIVPGVGQTEHGEQDRKDQAPDHRCPWQPAVGILAREVVAEHGWETWPCLLFLCF